MDLVTHPIDITIVVVYLIATVVFGLQLGRARQDLSSYLLGGRDIPWWAVLGSIVATETSTATFLGVPAISYAAEGDFGFLQLALGYIVGRCLVAVVLVPRFFDGKLFSAYEVLGQRFGTASKRIASLMFLVARNLGDGLRLFLMGIVLQQVVGLNLAASIAVVGILTIVYSYVGGMRAIVWNDCIQFVVYMVGGIIAAVVLTNQIPGSWTSLQEFAQDQQKFVLFHFELDFTRPLTFWAGIIGGATLTLGTHGTDQMMVQRYLSARSCSDAQRAVVLSAFVVLLQFALFLFVGVALACFYSHFPPRQPFERNDEVFATFIVTQLPVGLVGIMLAAVFSAAMSTLSSSLNSSSSAAVNDFYLPLRKLSPDSNHALRASRAFTLFFGGCQILVAIIASYYSRTVVGDALAIAGFVAGVLLGVFVLGVLTTRVDQRGAVAGMIAGLSVLTAVKFGTMIAWPWYPVIGSITTIVVGYTFPVRRKEA